MVAEMNPAIMPTSTHSGGHMNALSQYPAGLHLASATKELVLKDYALESDETHIYNAAHLMVASLAGSLAHVTCKEPLRGSISSQLRNSFQSLNIANELLEQDVTLVMKDNLDLGCVVVENAATDKALQTIGASYYDARMYTQGPMGLIPEALCPRNGHLSYSQQWVYEDFVRVPWQNQSVQSSNAGLVGLPASSSGSANSGLSHAYLSSEQQPEQFNSGIYSSGFSSTGSSMITRPVDLITEEMNPSSAQFYSSVALFPSPAAGSELHSVEASCTVEVHEANQEIIQDQITRVLLEWLIVSRPHPYNLH